MIELFVLENCPYCRKVMEYFDSHNIEYKKLNISEPDNLNKLVELGGKGQVPFLNDPENNISMYESNDIIDHVSKMQ